MRNEKGQFQIGFKHTEESKRKISLASNGRELSLETRKRISEARKGMEFSQIHKNNISKGKKGQGHSLEVRKRLSEIRKEEWATGIRKPTMTGKHHTEEAKRKISEAQSGEKSYWWKGGISKNLYPSEFSVGLKLKIRTRDNFTCCRCGITEEEHLEKLGRVLSVNHIDFNKDNCSEENLNTLCVSCNTIINKDREYWTNQFNKKNYATN